MHAGDAIAVLTQAKLPQVYRDEGAFDRRAYLSQHGVDLVAALRAGELLELVKPGRPSVAGGFPACGAICGKKSMRCGQLLRAWQA